MVQSRSPPFMLRGVQSQGCTERVGGLGGGGPLVQSPAGTCMADRHWTGRPPPVAKNSQPLLSRICQPHSTLPPPLLTVNLGTTQAFGSLVHKQ
ncbi:unnamed protein product [Lota lota]